MVNPHSSAPTLSEAAACDIEAKSRSKGDSFRPSVIRAVDYFSKCCGDKSIDGITRADVNAFRDSLLNRGLAQSSCKRIISVLRAILNFVCREYELNEISAFSGIHFQEDNFVIDKKRKPLPTPVIKELQQECKIPLVEPRGCV